MFKKLSIALAALAAVCTIGLGLFASAPNAFANTNIPSIATNVGGYLADCDCGGIMNSASTGLAFTGFSYQGAWGFYENFLSNPYTWSDGAGTSSYWYDGATGTDGTVDFKFGVSCNSAHPHTGSLSIYSYAWGKYATFQDISGEWVVEFNSSSPVYNMASTALCS